MKLNKHITVKFIEEHPKHGPHFVLEIDNSLDKAVIDLLVDRKKKREGVRVRLKPETAQLLADFFDEHTINQLMQSLKEANV